MSQIGDYLKRLRRERGLTLLEVKRLTGVSVGYLSEIEQGKRVSPHPEILKRLAPIYGASVEELLTMAGYLVREERPRVLSREDEIEWAFNAVLRDPDFGHFLDKERVLFMPLEMKLKLVRTYEKMTGKKLLPWKKD